MYFSFVISKHSQDMDSTGLVTAARARVKTGLVVYLAVIGKQKLLRTIGQYLVPVTKRYSLLKFFMVKITQTKDV